MAKQQRRPVAPPEVSDKSFSDFSAGIQDNLTDLYEDSHDHPVFTSIPADNAGSVGDIVSVDLEGVYYLYVKVTSDTWKRTAALS